MFTHFSKADETDKAYTEKQLRDKLVQGEYREDAVEEAIAYVKSYGYIDDRKYAEDFISCHMADRSRKKMELDLCRKGIDRKIIQEIGDSSFQESYQTDVCDILQCAGLLHDIGNPPFGHFGETVIREWFIKNLGKLSYKGRPLESWLLPQMKEDLYHFEGNTQALRLVTKLHYLVDEHGMNLTKGLLGTIIKYPVSSLEINKESGNIKDKKMGYYYAERDIFADLQESLGTNGARHPLSYVLEAADDIAYLTADIEDAFKKGCIGFGELVHELKECGKGEKGDEEYFRMANALGERYEKALARGVAQPENHAVQNWMVRVQAKLITCATEGFADNYGKIMNGTHTKGLLCDTGGERLAWALGDIAYRYAFVSKPILKLEIAAEAIMNFLLEKFMDAAIYYDTERKLNSVQEKIRFIRKIRTRWKNCICVCCL